jgi:hypothetical protein
MSTDPIVEELDQLRAEQMERFHFDFAAFYRDLQEQEKLSPQPVREPQESRSKERVSSAGRYAARR